jgi:hypothetical protein
LSLFSNENTQFEKFLADPNMSDKINKTLKKISNKNFIDSFIRQAIFKCGFFKDDRRNEERISQKEFCEASQ